MHPRLAPLAAILLLGCPSLPNEDAGAIDDAGTIEDAGAITRTDAGVATDAGVTMFCVPATTMPCTGTNGTGTSACTAAGDAFSACTLTACDPGFNLQSTACVANVCVPTSTELCMGPNGAGTRTCDVTGSTWGACALTACEPGYDLDGGACGLHVVTITRMNSNFDSTCGLVEGRVKCWGSDSWNTFDDLGVTFAHHDARTAFDGGITDFVMRGYGTYCRIEAGAVLCSSGYDAETIRSRKYVDAGATLVEADNFDACALVSGRVNCWNVNTRFNPPMGSEIPRPASLMDSDVVQLVMGAERCARTSGGAVKCWSGLGVRTVFTAGARKLVADQGSAICALINTDLYCWGNYWRPDGSRANSQTPELLMNDVTDVGVGSDYTWFVACVVKGGAMSCWGDTSGAGVVDAGVPLRTYFASNVRAVWVGSWRNVNVGFDDGGIKVAAYRALPDGDGGASSWPLLQSFP